MQPCSATSNLHKIGMLNKLIEKQNNTSSTAQL